LHGAGVIAVGGLVLEGIGIGVGRFLGRGPGGLVAEAFFHWRASSFAVVALVLEGIGAVVPNCAKASFMVILHFAAAGVVAPVGASGAGAAVAPSTPRGSPVQSNSSSKGRRCNNRSHSVALMENTGTPLTETISSPMANLLVAAQLPSRTFLMTAYGGAKSVKPNSAGASAPTTKCKR
jgi:hypothetical protein